MVAEIWRLWLQSGNAEVDAQMQHAVLLMGSGAERQLVREEETNKRD
jgi:hypothetical protein